MELPTTQIALSFLLVISTLLFSSSASNSDEFVQCVVKCSKDSAPAITKLIFTPRNSSYTAALLYSVNNLRFARPTTPKPRVIITPTTVSQIQCVIYCAKKTNLQIRIRSGGHSFEGHSYVAYVPFVILDLRNFNSVKVDVASATAWVGGGVTNGELYYRISQATSDYGFPAGLWANVGVGGLISGGGYGKMRRKYGLAADNTIDAILIDADGRILDRQAMGEDWFWAIRGGGGGSFGVVVAWKINLVPVPKIVTVFRVFRDLEQNMTNIFYRWQSVAPRFPKELDIRCNGQVVLSENSTRPDRKTMVMDFEALYLGRVDDLLEVMQQQFPELGLVREDCSEVSWIQAMVFFTNLPLFSPPELLLNTTILPRIDFKGRSDFTKEPIPIEGLQGIWDLMFQLPNGTSFLQFTPFGGRMSEIPDNALPFPYRAGYQYMLNLYALTDVDEANRLQWVRNIVAYLTPYVTRHPRSAYVNYINFWMGINNPIGNTSYAQARRWGKRYFNRNFLRLVRVKSMVDPSNFFRHEQSIPAIPLPCDK
ncbi:berberine bridge enzyme-like 8 [Apium graveolens]|uniref:berberine bridge enzyme-like 8 n=1 Tax=Apium graveolens TaxID=4045 RepID=UPI003D7BABE4